MSQYLSKERVTMFANQRISATGKVYLCSRLFILVLSCPRCCKFMSISPLLGWEVVVGRKRCLCTALTLKGEVREETQVPLKTWRQDAAAALKPSLWAGTMGCVSWPLAWLKRDKWECPLFFFDPTLRSQPLFQLIYGKPYLTRIIRKS